MHQEVSGAADEPAADDEAQFGHTRPLVRRQFLLVGIRMEVCQPIRVACRMDFVLQEEVFNSPDISRAIAFRSIDLVAHRRTANSSTLATKGRAARYGSADSPDSRTR